MTLPPTVKDWKFQGWGGGGGFKCQKNLKESMKLNWNNFREGWVGGGGGSLKGGLKGLLVVCTPVTHPCHVCNTLKVVIMQHKNAQTGNKTCILEH